MKDDRRDEFDDLLDSALASYAKQQPRPGLERRVLARIEDSVDRPNWWRSRWLWAIPALGCLLLIVLHSSVQQPPRIAAISPTSRPVAPDQQPRPAIGQNATAHPVIRRAIARVHTRVQAVGQQRPKRDQFPSPTAMTPEERALLYLVKHAPQETARWIEEHQDKIKPLQTQSIELEPLPIGQ